MSSGRDKYRTSLPSLSDVLAEQKGVDTAVVTIAAVKDQQFTDAQRGPRLALVIVTEEYPDNAYFPSTGKGGGVDRLYDKLGENQARWVGERIALVRVPDVFNPSTGTKSDKFHVAPVEEWDDILADFEKATRRTPARAAAPVARKRGGKR